MLRKRYRAIHPDTFFICCLFYILTPLPWSLVHLDPVYLVYCKSLLHHNSITWYILSCVQLCHPTGCSPPGSSVHGIFQVTILEWVAISFSRGSSLPRDLTCVFYVLHWCLCLPFCLPLPLEAPRTGKSPIVFSLQWALRTHAQISPFLSHLSLQAPTVQLLLCLSVSPGHQVLVTYTDVLHSSS